MEIFATIDILLFLVTLRLSIEHVIAIDWNHPKYVDMAKDENDPMKNKLHFLLFGNLDSAFVHSYVSIVSLIHAREEILCSSSLHVDISSFHGL